MIAIFFLVIVYSTIAPLITLLGAICFLFKYYVDKYNMLYVFPFEFESNGITINFLLYFTALGILMFDVYL